MDSSPYPPDSDAGRLQAKIRGYNRLSLLEREGVDPLHLASGKATCPKCGQPAWWFGCFRCHLHWGGGDPKTDAVDYSDNLGRPAPTVSGGVRQG